MEGPLAVVAAAGLSSSSAVTTGGAVAAAVQSSAIQLGGRWASDSALEVAAETLERGGGEVVGRLEGALRGESVARAERRGDRVRVADKVREGAVSAVGGEVPDCVKLPVAVAEAGASARRATALSIDAASEMGGTRESTGPSSAVEENPNLRRKSNAW